MSAYTDAVMGALVGKVTENTADARTTREAIATHLNETKAQLATTVTEAIMDVDKAMSQVKSRTKSDGENTVPDVDNDTVAALQAVMQFLPTILKV